MEEEIKNLADEDLIDLMASLEGLNEALDAAEEEIEGDNEDE